MQASMLHYASKSMFCFLQVKITILPCFRGLFLSSGLLLGSIVFLVFKVSWRAVLGLRGSGRFRLALLLRAAVANQHLKDNRTLNRRHVSVLLVEPVEDLWTLI